MLFCRIQKNGCYPVWHCWLKSLTLPVRNKIFFDFQFRLRGRVLSILLQQAFESYGCQSRKVIFSTCIKLNGSKRQTPCFHNSQHWKHMFGKKIPLKPGGKSTQTNNNRSPQNAREISEETNETNGRFRFGGAPRKDKKSGAKPHSRHAWVATGHWRPW